MADHCVPVPLSEKPFIATGCLSCPDKSENCCVGSYVPLTLRDVDAIRELGYDLAGAVQASEYFAEYLVDDEDWWRDSVTGVGGRLYRLTTKKREDGACVFLEEGKGCLLGPRRPVVCKIYPFWVDHRGGIIYEPGEEECCYIASGSYTLEEGIALIDESPGSIREYFQAIRQDCLENHDRHRELVETALGAAAPEA
ncbi:MAG TPA: YkgJ family cysteine cluster protein [Spirochaetes bacterium]|mgnify:CR=1 FL=1|nr:YkgJ family cysteine cluster protein [Spirochaetota bacterium]